ncbi:MULTISPECIES: hypothetical protein [unclassified Roseateles]|nr:MULTISPECIES: hypothetical protein [unclassified Roseateles]
MLKSARALFTATLIVSVLGFALTLCIPDEGEPADSPLATARLMLPPQR